LLINNWTKSTAENNPDNIAKLAWLKLKDGMCDDITTFKNNFLIPLLNMRLKVTSRCEH